MEYFWAETDGAGMVVSCDVSHMSSFTVKEAEAYISRIAVLNQPWGRDDGMRYFISELESGKGNLIVVADISNQLRSELRVLLLSLAAGAAGWFFMLILISLLIGRQSGPSWRIWKNRNGLSQTRDMRSRRLWRLSWPIRMRWSFIRERRNGAVISGDRQSVSAV